MNISLTFTIPSEATAKPFYSIVQAQMSRGDNQVQRTIGLPFESGNSQPGSKEKIMFRRLAALILSISLCGWSTSIALADDQPAPPASDAKPAPAGKAADGNVAKRMAAFLTGVVVGTPIAVVRKTIQCTVSDTKELVGENRNPFFLVPAGMLAFPWGLFSGGVEGLYDGVADSWVNSADKPFSKESFSLGEMK